MVKLVHKADMVAHLWANQSQDEARTASRNFYFEGRKLWSYGRHYLAGEIVDGADGIRSWLVSDDARSVTTRKHIRLAERAVADGLRCIIVPNLGPQAGSYQSLESAYKLQFAGQILDFQGKAARARSNRDSLLRMADLWAKRAAAFSDTFGFGWASMLDDAAGVLAADRADREAAYRLRQVAHQAEKDAAYAAGLDKIAAWLAGADVRLPSIVRDFPPQCRVIGDEVQTTWGASVPLADALLIVHLAKRYREGEYAGRPIPALRIGSFRLDMVRPNGDVTIVDPGTCRVGLRASCHGLIYPQTGLTQVETGVKSRRNVNALPDETTEGDAMNTTSHHTGRKLSHWALKCQLRERLSDDAVEFLTTSYERSNRPLPTTLEG
eukprot:gene19096-19455_t